MLELVGEVTVKRVLDAGCGPGLYSEALLASGADLVAVDRSVAIERARARLGTGAEVLRADLAEPLPFVASEFDLIVSRARYPPPRRSRGVSARILPSSPAWRPRCNFDQHPTADWLRKGGSYFEVKEEEDAWHRGDNTYTLRFWREPLTSLCAAIANTGFLIERLVEPLPASTMRERWPEHWEKLQREPGFVVLRLVKP